jgi:predicted short-subunit dehydrogenase-like oxidoreductase (DUF2520 family)
MATKPKPLSESKRPRRRAGGLVRTFFTCPFCDTNAIRGGSQLRIVAYRTKTVRVECGACGGRFSFDARQLAAVTAERPPREDGQPDFFAWVANEIAWSVGTGELRDAGVPDEEIRAVLEDYERDD